MLKKDITYTYTNLDDEEVTETETFYFNIAKNEIIDLEVEFDGFDGMVQKMMKEKDNQKMYDLFKRLILMSYGVRADDGKRFEKSEELSRKFSQTAAYDALIVEFFTSESVVADFIIGIMPKDMVKKAEKEIAEVLSGQTTPETS